LAKYLATESQSRGTGLSLPLRSSAGMRFGSARTVPTASLYSYPVLACPGWGNCTIQSTANPVFKQKQAFFMTKQGPAVLFYHRAPTAKEPAAPAVSSQKPDEETPG